MSYDVSKLKPELIWKYFDRIRKIPRCSGSEGALAEAIVSWSTALGAFPRRDNAGNVVVEIPPTPGFEGAPGIVLQGHMDMVCEKHREKVFDFKSDAIVLKREGEWITADGTTLGADNGIGLAAALAFMEEVIPHGPLEVLATVEEETGLYGALDLDTSLIKSRLLFNFDSEEDGIFYVGCAGGRDTKVTLPLERKKTTDAIAYQISVGGLLGGHSGLDIVLNRGNAVVLLARLLDRLNRETAFELCALNGGDKHNAIPREATATVLVSTDCEEKWTALLAEANADFVSEHGSAEPDITAGLKRISAPDSCFTRASTERAIDLILSIPNGVMAMMREIPEIVETSNNLARVNTHPTSMTILSSSRSAVNSASAAVGEKLRALCRLASATYEEVSSYPGWKPNMSSPMLARAQRIWTSVHGVPPEVRVVHAGLECGIIGEKFSGMDMISIGPTIENPHSPSERVHIPSVERFYAFAKAFIADVAKG
jgi:dipeptidase D